MAIRDIRPSTPHTSCDVCGRTLLRGERAEAYIHGGARRWVCDLCKSRALHEGWVREGTRPADDEGAAGSGRRRSLLSRFRFRREPPSAAGSPSRIQRERAAESPAAARPEPSSAPALTPPPRLDREPRHVRAIPASPEQKIASAVQVFNSSAHTRTVSGVARSLGLPTVAVSPSEAGPSLVNVVISWELCWYRYEIDLSDEMGSVRVAAQGYELEDLPAAERQGNATARDSGALSLAR